MEEQTKQRLEELRKALRDENISTGELIELQSLKDHIEPNDVELLEAAGVPEFEEDNKVLHGNKVIAEFEGYELEETLKGEMVYDITIDKFNPNKINDIATEFYYPSELKYHLSCDWLMPIVEKIRKNKFVESFNISIYENARIEGEEAIETFYEDTDYSNTQMTFQACVEWIEWYNKSTSDTK